MEGRGSQEAVMERLGISLSKIQSAELYNSLSNCLADRDAYAYVDMLRTKYELLTGGLNLQKCEYMIMEILLEKFEREHPLILASLTYVVKYKS